MSCGSLRIDWAGNPLKAGVSVADDLQADEGPTLRDARHRFVASGIFSRLPLGLEASTIFSFQSARPFNITTGSDDNGDGHLKDRPPGTGRNAGRADATYVWDLRLSRPFQVSERIRLIPTLDVFNVVNHPNFDPESFIGALNAENHATAVELAAIPEAIRGFGHVRVRHVEAAKRREAELLAAFRGRGEDQHQGGAKMTEADSRVVMAG